jgi:hypothetical protein
VTFVHFCGYSAPVLVLVYRIRKPGNQEAGRKNSFLVSWIPYLISNQEGRSEAGSWFHGFLIESKGGGLPTRRYGAIRQFGRFHFTGRIQPGAALFVASSSSS